MTNPKTNHKKSARTPVSVRLSSRERAIVKARAEAEGLGQGEYMRRLIVAQIGTEEQVGAATERAVDAALVAGQLAARSLAHLMVMQRAGPADKPQIEEQYRLLLDCFLPSEEGEGEGVSHG